MIRRQLRPSGFSLIELIAAMTAATVLLASLAATVLLSTRLLETPLEDHQQWHDQEIADRIATDLRYATTVVDGNSSSLELVKPNADSGASETVLYQANFNGLTRRVDSGLVMALDAAAPGQTHEVDGYTGATYQNPDQVARVRAVTSVASSGSASYVLLDVPPGCQEGDLLVLAVVSRRAFFSSITPNGWTLLQWSGTNDLRLIVYVRPYSASLDASYAVVPFPAASIAAAMVAIENVDLSSIGNSTGRAAGYAAASDSSSHPTPIETANADRRHLNLQIIGAQFQPWHSRSLGLPAFTDIVQATAASGDSSLECSLGIVVRNGPTPDLQTTPRIWQQVDGYWGQIGIQLGATP